VAIVLPPGLPPNLSVDRELCRLISRGGAGARASLEDLEVDDGRFCCKCHAPTAGEVTDFATTTGADQPEEGAVLRVETSGCRFLPDKPPKILFERH
jgi:hypothetical protein